MIQALGKQKALMAASFGWLLGSATDQPSKGSFQKDVSSSERPAHARAGHPYLKLCMPELKTQSESLQARLVTLVDVASSVTHLILAKSHMLQAASRGLQCGQHQSQLRQEACSQTYASSSQLEWWWVQQEPSRNGLQINLPIFSCHLSLGRKADICCYFSITTCQHTHSSLPSSDPEMQVELEEKLTQLTPLSQTLDVKQQKSALAQPTIRKAPGWVTHASERIQYIQGSRTHQDQESISLKDAHHAD
eukprot:1161942-Pelagomonas_calceolata.AAC.9